MVARPPDKDAIMPRLSLRSRANQFAEEPESPARMQLSGSRDESSQNTRCGLMGSADCIACPSSVFHQSATLLSIFLRQALSDLRLRRGIKARSVSPLSPTRLTSIG